MKRRNEISVTDERLGIMGAVIIAELIVIAYLGIPRLMYWFLQMTGGFPWM